VRVEDRARHALAVAQWGKPIRGKLLVYFDAAAQPDFFSP
jgi:hypothetical protein